MRRRALAGAGAAALGAATAIAALAVATTTAAAAPGTSSAYGVFISNIVDPPQPAVESTDGKTNSDSAAEIPGDPLLNVALAEVSAGDSMASAKLAGVKVLPGAEPPAQLDPLFEGLEEVCANLPDSESPIPPPEGVPDDLQELCNLMADPPAMDALLSVDLIEVSCDGTSGSTTIAGVSLFGQDIDVDVPDPNMGLPENPLINITVNKQTTSEDGFTVQGLVVDLAGEFQIILSSVTCGAADEPKPTAPKPTPVTTQLPVTG